MQNTSRSSEYRQKGDGVSSPFRLVLVAYDLAIRACEQQDFDRATRTISLLCDALNYDYEGVAV